MCRAKLRSLFFALTWMFAVSSMAQFPCPNATWLPGAGIAGTDGEVKAVVSWDPDGPGVQPAMLVVGGLFTKAGNTTASNIAAWNGSSWVALGSGTDNQVSALAVFNGELIAGGSFANAGGISASRIARWNGSSWQPLGAGVNQFVGALCVFNNELVVGGGFTSAGGSPAGRIARWNGSTWSTFGSGMNDFVQSLAVFNNDLIAGGSFTSAGGAPASAIARWNGSTWTALGSGFNNSVLGLAVFNADLIAGGLFTASGATTTNRVARWNGSSWIALGTGVNDAVNAVGVFGNELIAAGKMTQAGSASVRNVARWDGTQWRALSTPAPNGTIIGVNDAVNAIGVHAGQLAFGGLFTSTSNSFVFETTYVPMSRVARWDGAGWQPVGGGVGNGATTGTVRASTTFNGDLIAGGTFTTIGGIAANSIARWNGTSWQALGAGVTANSGVGTVSSLGVFNNELFVGGSFSTAGGLASANIARWNGSTWIAFSPGTNSSGNVTALQTYAGALYAAGNFSSIGGVTASWIARWNGLAWSPLGTGISGGFFGPGVYALAEYNGDLYAAGKFTTAGGVTVANIARWNLTNWAAVGTGTDSDVDALVVWNGSLIAGGQFSSAGGVGTGPLAAWSGSAWSPVSALIAGSNPTVNALTTLSNVGPIPDLVFGGNFVIQGPQGGTSLARLAPTGLTSPGTGISGVGSGALDPIVLTLTPYQDPKLGTQLIVGGTFLNAGTEPSTSFARFGCASCYPNCDGSIGTPVLSAGDFVCFLSKFRAGDAYANCDGSTGSPLLSAADFVCFLNAFRAGCP